MYQFKLTIFNIESELEQMGKHYGQLELLDDDIRMLRKMFSTMEQGEMFKYIEKRKEKLRVLREVRYNVPI